MHLTATPWAMVDLFSGCGGLSAGFHATGAFETIYAADLDEWANATFEANLGVRPERLDFASLSSEAQRAEWSSAIRSKVRGRKLIVAGGPPCQGFSSHVKARGDVKGRNNLFSLFGELALSLQPDVILIENVGDLVSTRSWHLFDAVRRRFESAGYKVRAKILNFAEFGVPQERFRTIVIASRGGEVTFPPPKRSHGDYATVRQWIGSLPAIAPGDSNPSDPMHETSRHRASTIEILRSVPHDGGSRPAGVGPACLDRTRASHGGYTDVYGRLAWDSPAPTMTARCRTPSCGRFAHPTQDRGLSAREAALLQTFPPEWQFSGPFDDRFKQIGNAVPPLAAQALAAHIADGMPAVQFEAGVLEVLDNPVGASFSVLIPGIRRRAAAERDLRVAA